MTLPFLLSVKQIKLKIKLAAVSYAAAGSQLQMEGIHPFPLLEAQFQYAARGSPLQRLAYSTALESLLLPCFRHPYYNMRQKVCQYLILSVKQIN